MNKCGAKHFILTHKFLWRFHLSRGGHIIFLQVFGNWFNASTQIPKLLLDLLQLKKNGPGVFSEVCLFPISTVLGTVPPMASCRPTLRHDAGPPSPVPRVDRVGIDPCRTLSPSSPLTCSLFLPLFELDLPPRSFVCSSPHRRR